MLSINTNFSSLIAQSSMKTSTNKLNQAIERMSTGYKFNHAKDNAANYSISTNMTTKINAYQVAEENAAMGLDMLATANGTLDLIQDKLARLRALAVQSANGTYGNQSKEAINTEANALVDEIERIYNTSEYNGINLLNNDKNTVGPTDPPQAMYNGFIAKIEKRDTSSMTKLSEVTDTTVALADGEYSISTAQELATLATMTNAGLISEGDTFVLAKDIDLAQWCADHAGDGGWTPIGLTSSGQFAGTFDGNGYKITNLKINATANFASLFGRATGLIKNVGVENVDIYSTGACVAGLVAFASNVENCYTTGKIETTNYTVGGLIGQLNASTVDEAVKDCYSTCNVIAGKTAGNTSNAGGLIGSVVAAFTGKIVNCFAVGDVSGEGFSVGGLIGRSRTAEISNCYATGNEISVGIDNAQAGGLIGTLNGGTISNCYATGNVSGVGNWAGGLIGANNSTDTSIENSYATGNVSSRGDCVGGLIGGNHAGMLTITSSYCTGDVSGGSHVGGLIGINNTGTLTITSSYCTGNVFGGTYNTGGFCGYVNNDTALEMNSCYFSGYVKGGTGDASGIVGYLAGNGSLALKNCYMLGDYENVDAVFVYAGSANNQLTVENCYYRSDYDLNETALFKKNDDTILTFDSVQACGRDEPFGARDSISIGMQIGIDSSDSSRLDLETSFNLMYLSNMRAIGLGSFDFTANIDYLNNIILAKQVEYGAAQNRLESALDEIYIRYDNLVSSRSTLRDADMAELSSTYIQQQILQQASATLLATANQSPAIALQLI